MNKIPFILLSNLLIIFSFTFCGSGDFAKDREKENDKIANYINKSGIEVIRMLPTTLEDWKPNQYYQSKAGGIYFQLVDPGKVDGDSVSNGMPVDFRFKKYTLDYTVNQLPDTIMRDWEINPSVEPMFKGIPYDKTHSSTYPCKGWHEAITYMKHNHAIAKIIVPSDYGMDNEIKTTTPMGYIIKISFE